jgi:hypothetical protein
MRSLPGCLLVFVLPSLAAAAGPPATFTAQQRAAARGLAFLDKQANAQGFWVERRQRSVAATSLAVLAFLSAGHEPEKGPYGKTIERGIRWVLSQQRADGVLAGPITEMYHHGIALFMLAQAHGCSSGALQAAIGKALDKGVALLVKAQGPTGGWRYRPTPAEGDMSITGWQIIALVAARHADRKVPAATLDKALRFALICQRKQTGGFVYMRYSGNGGPPSPSCTAGGIIALTQLGQKKPTDKEVQRAGQAMVRGMPPWTGSYYLNAAVMGNLAARQVGGKLAETFHGKVRDELLKRQAADGSWTAGGSERIFGSSYGTALAVLTLGLETGGLEFPVPQPSPEPEK